MSQVREYADTHFQSFVEQLKELVRIPSVSFDGFPPSEVESSAKAVALHLKETGLENIEILKIPGAHPYVYGDWLKAKGAPTLLLYAHHDVQPPGRLEKWTSPPFEPTERNGRLFGRGSADDKAGIVVHTAAIRSFLETTHSLPVNVKLLIEGEEEIGSGHLDEFLRIHRDKLQADIIVLTDTSNFDTGIPTITTSLRGLVSMEVTVSVMDHPLHSGAWGGPVPDPVIALSKMIAALVDEEGRMAIPGIYDGVRPLNPTEQDSLDSLRYTEGEFRRQAMILPGVELVGGKESPLQKMTRIPSLAVNAIQASSRKDVANVINEAAWCKVAIRTVPDMDAEKTESALREFLQKNAPWGVKVEFKTETNAPWWLMTPQGAVFDVAQKALTSAFGRQCVFVGCGGSIPFVGPFSDVLGAPALLMGVEDPYTNAHSENESLHLGDFRKSIHGAIEFYSAIATTPIR